MFGFNGIDFMMSGLVSQLNTIYGKHPHRLHSVARFNVIRNISPICKIIWLAASVYCIFGMHLSAILQPNTTFNPPP